MSNIFFIPVLEKVLIYSPLQRYARILQEPIPAQLIDQFQSNRLESDHQELKNCCDELSKISKEIIQPLSGSLKTPLFLGLITTRGCNMACRYCDFSAPKSHNAMMSMDLAKRSVDEYLKILVTENINKGEIEFFGGEPFLNRSVIEFAVGYARKEAKKFSVEISFNVVTNGLLSTDLAEWVADNFDSVTISIDGFPEFQNRNRPILGGQESFEKVFRTAKILSDSLVDLVVRVCITNESVHRMTEIGQWIGENLKVKNICFESLSPSPLSASNNLFAPDPVEFAREFLKSEEMLERIFSIPLVKSGVDIEVLQVSFCPVGKDAIIVSPTNKISACYLLENDWETKNLDMNFGVVTTKPSSFLIDYPKLETVRSLSPISNSDRGTLCNSCYCKYHCAGGCLVNRSEVWEGKLYDSVCIETRLITLGKILKRVGSDTLFNEWSVSLN